VSAAESLHVGDRVFHQFSNFCERAKQRVHVANPSLDLRMQIRDRDSGMIKRMRLARTPRADETTSATSH